MLNRVIRQQYHANKKVIKHLPQGLWWRMPGRDPSGAPQLAQQRMELTAAAAFFFFAAASGRGDEEPAAAATG